MYSKELIIRFLGYEIKENIIFGYHPKFNLQGLSINQTEFNKSWDWLMPVIEEIESLDCSQFSYNWETDGEINYNFYKPIVEIKSGECWIYFDCQLDPYLTISDCNDKEKTTLENTYKAVIEFIEWYNKVNLNSYGE